MTRRQAINALIALSFLSSPATAQVAQRSYTVKEIDELRQVVENKLAFGNYTGIMFKSQNYLYSKEETLTIEEQVRTWMLAGKTADDLRNSENGK